MKNVLAVLLLWCSIGAANAQITYTSSVGNYISVTDFASCPGGETCTNYTTAMRQSGSFTVAAALAPNLANADIAGLVTSYSFSDGINTYSNTNADNRIGFFSVSTDASGAITAANIFIQKWLSGTSGSHAAGDRFSYIWFGSPLFVSQSVNNTTCGNVSTVGDVCISEIGGIGSSFAEAPLASWAPVVAAPPTPVPTLSEWAMIIMASLMALFAIRKMRRQ